MSKEALSGAERNDKARYTPTLEQAREFARAGCRIIPVYRTLSGDLETPGRIYLKLSEERLSGRTPSFLLESVEVGEKLGRYSYVGVNPKIAVEISSDTGKVEQDPLRILESRVPGRNKVAPVEGLPPFFGGFVGYLGYECVSLWEPTVPVHPNTIGLPDAVFFEAKDLIVYDHIQQQMKILSNVSLEDPAEIDEQYEKALQQIESTILSLYMPLDSSSEHPLPLIRQLVRPVSSNFSKEEYEETVSRAKEHILAGDIFQIVTSQRLSKKTPVDPYTIYRHYRQTNPSPYMFYMDFGEFQLIGMSPEILVKTEGGKITYRPLAGTRRRGKTPEEDQDLAEELQNDPKERAEHVMLVDLGRNDVGRVAVPGTLTVPELMTIEYYSRVMHLSSEIQAELDPQFTGFDAIRATFPAGTVSGAPKVRAMQLINKFEPERRGPYSGAVGHVSYGGDVTMAIAIRTLVKKEDTVYAQAGGGIVADSDPSAEYQETMDKASAGLKALELAETEEL